MATRQQLRRKIFKRFRPVLEPTYGLGRTAERMMRALNDRGAMRIDSKPSEKV